MTWKNIGPLLLVIYNAINLYTEAVVQKCSVKQVFLKILQNSQENNCDGAPFY